VSKSEDEMKEYIGNRVDTLHQRDRRARIKIRQPVLVQKLWVKFDLPGEKKHRRHWQHWVGYWSRVMMSMHSIHKMQPCTNPRQLFACTKYNSPDLTFTTLPELYKAHVCTWRNSLEGAEAIDKGEVIWNP
jgi:hypothetical protein